MTFKKFWLKRKPTEEEREKRAFNLALDTLIGITIFYLIFISFLLFL